MNFHDRIPYYVLALSLPTVALGFVAGPSIGTGALVGAVLANANGFALRRLVFAIMKADSGKRTGVSILLFFKTAAVLVASALLLVVGRVDPIGFALGISVLVLGLLIGSLHFFLLSLRPRVALSRSGQREKATDHA